MEREARTPSFGHALSDAGRFSQIPGRVGSRGHECQDAQCAEEGLNPEECGDENHAPTDEHHYYGFDKRPLLPFALTSSTFASAWCTMLLHIPLWGDLTGDATITTIVLLPAYTIVLVSMAYTALCDPGQLYQVPSGEAGHEPSMPRRARKAWLYTHPIRRYDHYCRWLMNVIGLLNHRSFMVMCGGLVLVTACGGFMDMILAFFAAHRLLWSECWILILHLGYCCAVLGFLGPVFRLHIGLVSKNELAHEWNKNFHYVAWSEKNQMRLPVNDLSDDEFNDQFDNFEYDRSRNPWDRGDAMANCWAFWFTTRSEADELGEF